MLYPYFKDFDRGAGYTRSVTKGQFARILNFSSIKLSAKDLDLLYCLSGLEIFNYPPYIKNNQLANNLFFSLNLNL